MLSQAKHFFESSDTTSRVVQAEADLLVDVVAVLNGDGTELDASLATLSQAGSVNVHLALETGEFVGAFRNSDDPAHPLVGVRNSAQGWVYYKYARDSQGRAGEPTFSDATFDPTQQPWYHFLKCPKNHLSESQVSNSRPY
jgi:hypothetical protein